MCTYPGFTVYIRSYDEIPLVVKISFPMLVFKSNIQSATLLGVKRADLLHDAASVRVGRDFRG